MLSVAPPSLDLKTLSALLAAAGDPLAVSTHHDVVWRAWASQAELLVAGDPARFIAWSLALDDLMPTIDPVTAEACRSEVLRLEQARRRS